jgi:hypothetical protein
VFVSERGSPFTTAGCRKMIARLGEAARFSFPVQPAHVPPCGYKLANDGRDTRALQSPDRFRDFWRDYWGSGLARRLHGLLPVLPAQSAPTGSVGPLRPLLRSTCGSVPRSTRSPVDARCPA